MRAGRSVISVRSVPNCQRRPASGLGRHKLASVGLNVERRAVKGYLNSLKRKGRITSVRPGVWNITDSDSLVSERDVDAANNFGPAMEAGPKEASPDEETLNQGAV